MPSKRKNGKAKRNRTTNRATEIHPEQDSLRTVFTVSNKTVIPRHVQVEIGQRVQWTYEEAELRQQNMSPRIICKGLFKSDKLTPSNPSFAYSFRSRGLYEVVISSRPNILQSIKVVSTEGECYTESDSFADSDDDFSDDNFPYVSADDPASDHIGLDRPFVAAGGHFVAVDNSPTKMGACALDETESGPWSSNFANIAVTKRQRKLITQHSASSSIDSGEDDKKVANFIALNSFHDSDIMSDRTHNEKPEEIPTPDLEDLPLKSQVHPSKGLEPKLRCPYNPLAEGKDDETHSRRFALEQPFRNCTRDSTSPLAQTDVSRREDTYTSENDAFVPGVCGVEESKVCSGAGSAKGAVRSDEECGRDDRSVKTASVESPQETFKEDPLPPSKPRKEVVSSGCKRMSTKAIRRKQKRQNSNVNQQMGNGKQLEVPQAEDFANANTKKKQSALEKKIDSDTILVATENGPKSESAKKKREQRTSSTSRRVESYPPSTSQSRKESSKLAQGKACDRIRLSQTADTRCRPGKQESTILSQKQSKEKPFLKKQRTPLRENVTDQADDQSTRPFFSSSDERPQLQQDPQGTNETVQRKDKLVDTSKPQALDSGNEAPLSSMVQDKKLSNRMNVPSSRKGEQNDCFNEAAAEQILLERWRKIERLIENGHSEGVLNF